MATAPPEPTEPFQRPPACRWARPGSSHVVDVFVYVVVLNLAIEHVPSVISRRTPPPLDPETG